MLRLASGLIFSPSDLHNYLECAYLTRLDRDVLDGRTLEKRRDPQADLLAKKGEAHERARLAYFRDAGKVVVEITDPGPAAGWPAAREATVEAMRDGADVIYQAVVGGDVWRGRADFLVRVDAPSVLGPWSYEVWDTKLARHPKVQHLLQLGCYSSEVANIQKMEPQSMWLVLGTGDELPFQTRRVTAYLRAIQRKFLQALHADEDVAPYPVSHCGLCGYAHHCEQRWETEDHLSVVANIRRSQVERLREAGVLTTAHLAGIGDLSIGIGQRTLERLRHQASLQTHFRRTGAHRYELLPADGDNGFRLLPAPSAGDVFFDMEGFPYFETSRGLEYLFGLITADNDEPRFRVFRALNRDEEKQAFEQFIDFVWGRLIRWPDLHVYHYAHYEPTALKRLTAFHGTREEILDELLRREVFVDLYQVVRRSIRISHTSYSIKAVRQFFRAEPGPSEVTDAAQSILEFQRWLDTGDPSILTAIEQYNEEDCRSTWDLRNWLLQRKREAEDQFEVQIPFFSASRRDDPVEPEPDRHQELRGRLNATAQPWATTLGHLLDYHRREAKPEWWAYFARAKKSLDELLDDTEAISHLKPTDDAPESRGRSLVYALEFPPQEFKLKADAVVEAPFGAGRAGTIEWLDASRGRLGLRRPTTQHGNPLPLAVVLGRPIPDTAQRMAVERVAKELSDGRRKRQRRYRAVLDIMCRNRPHFLSARPGPIQTLELEEQKRLVSDLDRSYLVVQGPPGTGKTWTGARLIVSLIRNGRRVGVTAPSHRAIHNLLEEIERVALEENFAFYGLKKRSQSDETTFEGRFITSLDTNEECESSDAPLLAGTAWLFAREGMDQTLDYLFIDEAGQFALADAVAVGASATNLVLLGDPRQLPHVTQNVHPEGAGRSVLEHLLGTAMTIPEDRGIFLARSWRLHPDICQFVSDHSYEGRLTSAPGCEHQRVSSAGLNGAGLRYLPVEHRHNAQQSAEEAVLIRDHVERLLKGGTVTDSRGRTRAMKPDDVLVVAPYNMQLRSLADVLPDGVEVGTVDKFQGREAAVVFFSMTSSTGEDVPRGLDFLFNSNRFNVAISRARCLSVVVCSPRLLEARCRTTDQVPLVNALCRFVECAVGGVTAGNPAFGAEGRAAVIG